MLTVHRLFSHRNGKFAFVRQSPSQDESSIVVFDCTGAGELKLTSRRWNSRFSPEGLSWSPDGTLLGSAALDPQKGTDAMGLVLTNTKSGDQQSFGPGNFKWIGQVSWVKDGGGIAFPAFNETSPDLRTEIWFASFPDAQIHRIVDGVNGASGVSLTGDSNIVTTKSTRVSELWTSTIGDTQNATLIQNNIGDDTLNRLGMDWTANGKIVYSSSRGDNSDIWMVNADGTSNVQLSSDAQLESEPIASRDGKYIFFVSNRTGSRNIWRMNLDGKDSKQITKVDHLMSYTVSADGARLYYTAGRRIGFPAELWETSMSGHNKKITDVPVLDPQVSPDGKLIVCLAPDKNSSGNNFQKLLITLISTSDKTIVQQFGSPIRADRIAFSWPRDSRSFFYSTTLNGVSNIWHQSLKEIAPTQITNLSSEQIFRFAHSKADDRIAFEKGFIRTELVLITDITGSARDN